MEGKLVNLLLENLGGENYWGIDVELMLNKFSSNLSLLNKFSRYQVFAK